MTNIKMILFILALLVTSSSFAGEKLNCQVSVNEVGNTNIFKTVVVIPIKPSGTSSFKVDVPGRNLTVYGQLSSETLNPGWTNFGIGISEDVGGGMKRTLSYSNTVTNKWANLNAITASAEFGAGIFCEPPTRDDKNSIY